MSVQFFTDTPKALLNEFDKRIAQSDAKGKINTWLKDGDYYTHKANDWTKKAWFLPSVESGKLVFNIIKPKGSNVSTIVYGYYHGHLTETFLNHFDKSFNHASSSALPVAGDRCSS